MTSSSLLVVTISADVSRMISNFGVSNVFITFLLRDYSGFHASTVGCPFEVQVRLNVFAPISDLAP